MSRVVNVVGRCVDRVEVVGKLSGHRRGSYSLDDALLCLLGSNYFVLMHLGLFNDVRTWFDRVGRGFKDVGRCFTL